MSLQCYKKVSVVNVGIFSRVTVKNNVSIQISIFVSLFAIVHNVIVE